MDAEIDKKLDAFFEKSSAKYMEMSIFGEIFQRIDELENENQSLYFYELKRIRDIKNCLDTANEEGGIEGMKEVMQKIDA